MVTQRPNSVERKRFRRRPNPRVRTGAEALDAQCLDELLGYDLKDYITPWEVDGVVSKRQKGKHQQRKLALSIVDYGLRKDLVLIGDLEDGFVPWKVSTRREAIRRLDAIWKEPQDPKVFRLGFWLDRTEAGWIRSYSLVAAEHLPTRLSMEAIDRLLAVGLTGLITGEALWREARRAEAAFARSNPPKLLAGPSFGGILAAGLHQGFFVIGKLQKSGSRFTTLPNNRSYVDAYPKRLSEGELCLQITEAGATRVRDGKR